MPASAIWIRVIFAFTKAAADSFAFYSIYVEAEPFSLGWTERCHLYQWSGVLLASFCSYFSCQAEDRLKARQFTMASPSGSYSGSFGPWAAWMSQGALSYAHSASLTICSARGSFSDWWTWDLKRPDPGSDSPIYSNSTCYGGSAEAWSVAIACWSFGKRLVTPWFPIDLTRHLAASDYLPSSCIPFRQTVSFFGPSTLAFLISHCSLLQSHLRHSRDASGSNYVRSFT